MVAAQTNPDVLTRVRRDQKMRGKSTSFSGLRIVFAATAITLGILLFAFGAIGMLMMARSPQEPLASKLDPSPPVISQSELTPAPEVVASEPLVIPAPEPVPAASQAQLEKEAAAPSSPEPETTATIPNPAATPRQPAQQQNVVRRPQQQQAVRRPAQKQSESQSTNPLFQLFGIKQYK